MKIKYLHQDYWSIQLEKDHFNMTSIDIKEMLRPLATGKRSLQFHMSQLTLKIMPRPLAFDELLSIHEA